MANNKRELFSLEWEGLDDFRALLGDIKDGHEKVIVRKMNRFKTVPEKGAKALAPRDEKDLENDLSATEVRKVAGEFSFEIGTNLAYAAWLHERNVFRQGTYPKYSRGAKIDNYYVDGYGKRTRKKKAWKGYEPGTKYLENAVRGSEDAFDKINREILDEIMGG